MRLCREAGHSGNTNSHQVGPARLPSPAAKRHNLCGIANIRSLDDFESFRPSPLATDLINLHNISDEFNFLDVIFVLSPTGSRVAGLMSLLGHKCRDGGRNNVDKEEGRRERERASRRKTCPILPSLLMRHSYEIARAAAWNLNAATHEWRRTGCGEGPNCLISLRDGAQGESI